MANTEQQDDLQDLVGRELGSEGRYVLEKFIASGAYGSVYKGTDRHLEETVAIKVGISYQNFMREAKLAAAVRHDHIVHVRDYGSDHGLAYMVMEYLVGETLATVFERQGCRLPTELLLKFVNEVGNALSHAHSIKLIHRDLKPQNIILKDHVSLTGATTTKTKFVLLDFGIAAKTDTKGTLANKTQDGAATIEYMAPELARVNPKASVQSDIYAFGTILYQMITGRVPFPQEENSHFAQATCIEAICKSPVPPLRKVAPDREFPEKIQDLIFRCLAKEPEKRPASIEEVRSQFVQIYRQSWDTDEFEAIPNDALLPENPEDLLGRVFDDRYVLQDFIDRGGYGAVFKGVDQKMGPTVAIKVGLSTREFRKEARLAKELQHPSIVNVSDYGNDRGLAYLVMDYLNGQTLESIFVQKDRDLPPIQLRKLVHEIGEALAYAHDMQMIHRDLKPRNIILREPALKSGATTQQYRFVLLDFGIAAKMDSAGTLKNNTQDGAGTLEYMAPEVIHGDKATPQSDIYAFGVILYQMLTGTVPFPQTDMSRLGLSECVNAIMSAPVPSFQEVAPNRKHSAAIEKLVCQCLEKDPARRPQTMGDVRDRFLEIHDSESGVSPKNPRFRRQPRLGLLALLLYLVLGIWGAWTAYHLWRPQIDDSSFSVELVDANNNVISKAVDLEVGGQSSVNLKVSYPNNCDVSYSIPSEQNGLQINQSDTIDPHWKLITISHADVRGKPGDLVTFKLVANFSVGDGVTKSLRPASIERSVDLRVHIEPPRVWMPADNGHLPLQPSKDSWLCKIGSQVYQSILEGTIDDETVRFRLVPEHRVEKEKIATFYISESLISTRLFRKFATTAPGGVIESNKAYGVGSKSDDVRWWDPGAEAPEADLPATNIYVYEAQGFAEWLLGHGTGSLPELKEWELAAGYWDFYELSEAGETKSPDFEACKRLIPNLGVDAKFAKSPSESAIFDLKESVTPKCCSPYGCIIKTIAALGFCPTEFTCTVDKESETTSLRAMWGERMPDKSCFMGLPQDELGRAVLTGHEKNGEFTWIRKVGGQYEIKKPSGLHDRARNVASIVPHTYDKGTQQAFRVVLLTGH